MSQIVESAVQRYLAALNANADPGLHSIAIQGEAEQLPIVHADTGLLLHLLVAATGARRVLEIGTAVGYSGAWIATALPPGGRVITFERNGERAGSARRNFASLGVGDRVDVRVGEASRLIEAVEGPFDFIFQDGDKSLYAPLHDRIVELLRPDGLLAVDNTLWSGSVAPGFTGLHQRSPESVALISAYNERLATDPRLRAIFLPVGDGVGMAVKRERPWKSS